MARHFQITPDQETKHRNEFRAENVIFSFLGITVNGFISFLILGRKGKV